MSARRDFAAGVRAMVPILLGVVPFGLVTGVAAIDAGISPVQTVAMSVIVFAGASQLAAIELLGRTAPAAVVVATVLVINLRMTMYSASIAPYFRRFADRWRWLCAYLLTDQAYALSIAEYRRESATAGRRKWYYLGAASTLWVTWQLGTIAGVVLGANVPDGLSLEFAVPLTFLALLVPALDDRVSVLVAIAAGGTAVLAAPIPFNLGLLVAAVAGIAVGVGIDLRAGRFPRAREAVDSPGGDDE